MSDNKRIEKTLYFVALILIIIAIVFPSNKNSKIKVTNIVIEKKRFL